MPIELATPVLITSGEHSGKKLYVQSYSRIRSFETGEVYYSYTLGEIRTHDETGQAWLSRVFNVKDEDFESGMVRVLKEKNSDEIMSEYRVSKREQLAEESRRRVVESAHNILAPLSEADKEMILLGLLATSSSQATIGFREYISNEVISSRLTEVGFTKVRKTKVSDVWARDEREIFIRRKLDEADNTGMNNWSEYLSGALHVIAELNGTSFAYEHAVLVSKQLMTEVTA